MSSEWIAVGDNLPRKRPILIKKHGQDEAYAESAMYNIEVNAWVNKANEMVFNWSCDCNQFQWREIE